jgi:hypothetical protein
VDKAVPKLLGKRFIDFSTHNIPLIKEIKGKELSALCWLYLREVLVVFFKAVGFTRVGFSATTMMRDPPGQKL